MAVEPHIDSPNRPTTHWKPRAIVGVPRYLCLLDPLSSTFSRLFQRFQSATASYPARTSACQFFFPSPLARISRSCSEQRGAGGHPQLVIAITALTYLFRIPLYKPQERHKLNLTMTMEAYQYLTVAPQLESATLKPPTVQLKFSHNRCLSNCIYLR